MEDREVHRKKIGLWKVQMESLLIRGDLSLALEGKVKNSTVMFDEDWDRLEKKARSTIILSISNNVLFNVIE